MQETFISRSLYSCCVDVSAIKNALLKQQIYSKIPTVGAVEVFSLELFFFHCNVSSKNLLFVSICFFKKSDALYFFLQADSGWPALLETPGTSWKWITLLKKPPGKSKKVEKLLEMFWIYFFSITV